MPLAYYSRAATEEFWTEHWGGQDVHRLVDIAARSPLTGLIESALPASGRLLEAGCGLGAYVILLRARGHAVCGADWSLDALRRCRIAASSTPLAVMELGELAVKTGSLAAYVSLGVVEHDAGGPDVIVREAARALQPGGTLLLSVPYWNGVRRVLAPHLIREGRRVRAAGGQFYQFAFTRREVRRFLEAHGLRVVSFHPYDPARMWRIRFKRLAAMLGAGPSPVSAREPRQDSPRARRPRGLAFRAVLKRLAYSPISLRLFAHMILAVAIKRSSHE